MTSRGKFITMEGIDGAGKSSHLDFVCELIAAHGHAHRLTREPGGTAIGEKIRDLLQFAPESFAMAAETELLLFEASRSQLVREIIRPALEQGTIVISDRFFDSTTVYQGVARKLEPDMVAMLNDFAGTPDRPDLMRWEVMELGKLFGELDNAMPVPKTRRMDVTTRREAMAASPTAPAGGSN